MTYPGGRYERFNKDGSSVKYDGKDLTISMDKNGNEHKAWADGRSEGTIVYPTTAAKTWKKDKDGNYEETNSKGTFYKKADGSEGGTRLDGSSWSKVNGIITNKDKDGNTSITDADGNYSYENVNGDRGYTNKDGSSGIFKKDGSSYEKKADGSWK